MLVKDDSAIARCCILLLTAAHRADLAVTVPVSLLVVSGCGVQVRLLIRRRCDELVVVRIRLLGEVRLIRLIHALGFVLQVRGVPGRSPSAAVNRRVQRHRGLLRGVRPSCQLLICANTGAARSND